MSLVVKFYYDYVNLLAWMFVASHVHPPTRYNQNGDLFFKILLAIACQKLHRVPLTKNNIICNAEWQS